MTKNFRLPLIISLTALFFLNMLMVLSQEPSLILKQLFSWIIGLVLFAIGTQIHPKNIKPYRWLLFIFSTILILSPILLNNITRGSRRWINIGGLSIQPSEIVKPWLLLFLVNTNLPILFFIPVSLILIQPDLGSAVSTAVLALPTIIYNKKLLTITIIIGIIAIFMSPIIWKYGLHDYQRQRITTFINPQSDPLNKGYNVIQSQIAIGSGGFWGRGFKKGTQGQLLFLPEKHTDFIFAAMTEEMGFVSVFILILSYFLLINTLIKKAFSSTDKAQMLFTLGIASQIWIQAFINIGMNIGILPVTGIPLPFVSVGGSSLLLTNQ
ncbi:MAG: Rod shape-determining protein RodA [Candidatus Shapirobacteria bacterium GW2011_GWE1_38_92]|uniref:Rod shape-determining protein RodA n=1 Tax=Candidatus Shapirobacteria bacterium GW2011_GWE1_38_92 TaxID=1618489 RepID=A0A0G0NV91_9BACT|nr:MAG: Rod shape-determining protein RodA [Candidatus Shapirobacteria bacterium GW2011_GWE1_38_92]